MSKEYGYIGKEVTQSFRNNKGIFTPQDIIELDQENKWTNFGQLEFIETQTVSSVTDVDFNSIDENIYNVHFATWQFEKAVGRMDIRFYENGVIETGNVYQYARQTGQLDGTFAESRSTGFGGIPIDVGMTNKQSQGYIYFYNLGDSTKFSFASLQSFIEDYGFTFGSGVLPQTSLVDKIRFRNVDTANITGSISLYGIKEYS